MLNKHLWTTYERWSSSLVAVHGMNTCNCKKLYS